MFMRYPSLADVSHPGLTDGEGPFQPPRMPGPVLKKARPFRSTVGGVFADSMWEHRPVDAPPQIGMLREGPCECGGDCRGANAGCGCGVACLPPEKPHQNSQELPKPVPCNCEWNAACASALAEVQREIEGCEGNEYTLSMRREYDNGIWQCVYQVKVTICGTTAGPNDLCTATCTPGGFDAPVDPPQHDNPGYDPDRHVPEGLPGSGIGSGLGDDESELGCGVWVSAYPAFGIDYLRYHSWVTVTTRNGRTRHWQGQPDVHFPPLFYNCLLGGTPGYPGAPGPFTECRLYAFPSEDSVFWREAHPDTRTVWAVATDSKTACRDAERASEIIESETARINRWPNGDNVRYPYRAIEGPNCNTYSRAMLNLAQLPVVAPVLIARLPGWEYNGGEPI